MVSIKELERIAERARNRRKNLQNIVNKLQQQQDEAAPFKRTRIPKRRFGASVTRGKERQAQALETREQAKKFIEQKNLEKAQVQAQIEQVSEQERRANEEIRRRKRASKRAAQLFRAQQADRFASGETERDPSGREVFTEFGAAQQAGAVGSGVGGGFLDQQGNEFFIAGQSTPEGRRFFKTETIEAQESVTDRQAVNVVDRPEDLGFLLNIQRSIALERGGRDVSTIKGIGLGVASGAVSLALFGKQAVTEPVSTAKGLFVDAPVTVTKRILSGQGFPEAGAFLARDPAFATGRIAFEVALTKGVQVGVVRGLPVAEGILTRISPRFKKAVPVVDGKPVKFDAEGFKALGFKTGEVVTQKDFKLARKFAEKEVFGVSFKGAKDTKSVRFISSTFDVSAKEALATQPGRTFPAVGTAQRGLFGLKETVGRLAKNIEKPLPSKGSPELERSLFVSPPGQDLVPEIRPSRLGLEGQAPAKLLDIVSGDVTFKRAGKPQAVVFTNLEVEALPKSLEKLGKKLTSGKATGLETVKFAQQFVKFQLTPSGKAKPVGFIKGTEPELTIPPTEKAKVLGVPAVTVLESKKVKIIEAQLLKQETKLQDLPISTELKTLLDTDVSKIDTKAGQKRFLKNLERQLEFGSESSITPRATPPLNPIRTRGRSRSPTSSSILPTSSLISGVSRGVSVKTSGLSGTSPRAKGSSRFSSGFSGISSPPIRLTSPPTRPPSRPPTRPPARPPRRPPTIPPVRIPPTILRPRKQQGRITTRVKPRKRIEDDLFLAPDLTSRAIGKVVKIPKSKARKVAEKGFTGLELRGIPKIV